MSASPFDFQAGFARLWVDTSVQMMRTTANLWMSALQSPGSARSPLSTASPWWMPPQRQHAETAPLWPAHLASAWMPSWPQPLALPSFAAPTANPFLPWLPSLPSSTAGNPFALWQQMWLQAAAPSLKAPWLPSQTPATDALWQPAAAVYRTANGHAMAAVLRTMADVVEPKPAAFNPAHYWPTTLGTRH